MKITYGDQKKVEHLMLTKKQWMALLKEKKGGSTSKKNKDKQRPAKKHIAEQHYDEQDNDEQDGDEEEEEDDDTPPRRKKFDIKKVRCHNCRELGHLKSDCWKPTKKERALMAQEGDDSPMHLMCELVDEDDPVLQAVAKETDTLVEDKVCRHDHASETRVNAIDTGGDSRTHADSTGIKAYMAPEVHDVRHSVASQKKEVKAYMASEVHEV